MSEYSKEEILAMSELQLREEAAKLLGWEKVFTVVHPWTMNHKDKNGKYHHLPPANWVGVGAIVEALIEKEIYLEISVGSDKKWTVEISVPTFERTYLTYAGEADGETAFIAVTRAALIAKYNSEPLEV